MFPFYVGFLKILREITRKKNKKEKKKHEEKIKDIFNVNKLFLYTNSILFHFISFISLFNINIK